MIKWWPFCFCSAEWTGRCEESSCGSAQGCGWVAVSNGPAHSLWLSVCVSPQVVCGCQVPSCLGQTDIFSSAASPAWARLVPRDHVTVFSQHKQPYTTHQLVPTCYKSGATLTLQVSHTPADKHGVYWLNVLKWFIVMLTYSYSVINYICLKIHLHNTFRQIIGYILLL